MDGLLKAIFSSPRLKAAAFVFITTFISVIAAFCEVPVV